MISRRVYEHRACNVTFSSSIGCWIAISALLSAELSITSPRKLLIFTIKFISNYLKTQALIAMLDCSKFWCAFECLDVIWQIHALCVYLNRQHQWFLFKTKMFAYFEVLSSYTSSCKIYMLSGWVNCMLSKKVLLVNMLQKMHRIT